MDATLGAMRSASEQQLLARDCLAGGGDAHALRQGKEPSMECLMTLAWAIRVLDREIQDQQRDASGKRQAGVELEQLFRARSVKQVSYIGRSGVTGTKSIGGRRSSGAFERGGH